MPKRLTSHRPVFPFSVGEVVGWRGIRATVKRIHPGSREVDLATPGVAQWRRVQIVELHDPPEIPEHVQAAADEAVAGGMFSDPRRAVFGEGS